MDRRELLRTLKQSFGYDSFRPLQEEIIQDALAGRDVFALLPTGGGKSLCFQLPALLREGLTVVVSPLIALMKDQVDAMQAGGVAATFLNSTLDAADARARFRGLHNGEYRLLYIAPERLMLSGFLDSVKAWNVAQIAVDEAHCVSEWGHDFRPEYRQLAQLRDLFPKVPMMALTATATERVREDIVTHLRLRDARCFVASFNRPNLTYRVLPKARPYEQTLQFLRSRAGESGIVYCQSRKSTESVSERLNADGIRARPYHAGLEAETRATNQELFLRDEVRVICATIAFGMGINKPNVRFVIHYDLPKNIEGYYQETGRAGRDGLPSECLLLFSSGDVVKQTQFIDEKPDPDEQRLAREQLQTMVHYAEAASCRRASLLGYFGEEFDQPSCGGCDNCLAPRETFDGTLAAQKFLSCIYRLRAASRSGSAAFGLNHVIEVLTGANTERIRKWDHDKVSTYGIGREHPREHWQAIARELIRLGLCRQTTDKFSVLELTGAGVQALKARQSVTLTRPMTAPDTAREKSRRAGEIACDETLFEKLRTVRKQLADARDVPAYIVFSDVALRLMARAYPTTDAAFAGISGVGEKKRAEFGDAFLAAVREYLASHPRQLFGDELAEFHGPPPKKIANGNSRESWRMFASGQSIEQIARARGLTASTIVRHLADAIEAGEPFDMDAAFSGDEQAELEAAFEQLGDVALAPIKAVLNDRYGYDRLHLFRAARRRLQQDSHPA